MQWIAPSEKDLATDTLEKRLWAAADQLRASNALDFGAVDRVFCFVLTDVCGFGLLISRKSVSLRT